MNIITALKMVFTVLLVFYGSTVWSVTLSPQDYSIPGDAIIIDTRDSKSCSTQTITRARCLTANQMHYPDLQLASFRDINWLLGTLGISEAKDIVVIGDRHKEKFFVAGILHLMGLKQVTVVNQATNLLFDQHPLSAGLSSTLLRSNYLTTPLQDELIVLNSEFHELASRKDTRIINKLNNVMEIEVQGFKYRIIAATNPVEAIAYFASKITSLPAGRSLKVLLDTPKNESWRLMLSKTKEMISG